MLKKIKNLIVVLRVACFTLARAHRMLRISRRDPARARLFPREHWGAHILTLARAELEVSGGEEIDWSSPHIFVMNHQSLIDIPAVFLALPVGVCFVAKKELSYVPFFGRAMRAVGMIFVDRSKPEQALESLRAGGALIRSGINVIAFPEGTRSRDAELKPFKRGIFLLALQAKVPIIPMAIEGANEVLPPTAFAPRGGKIRLRIGAPIETAHCSDFEALRAVTYRAVEALIAELRASSLSSLSESSSAEAGADDLSLADLKHD